MTDLPRPAPVGAIRAVRLPDWQTRLAAYFDENAGRPHQYGAFDCALFVAGAVEAMTGKDFGAPFRGKYRSAAGSIRALREFGAGDLPATLTAALGPPGPLAFGHRGDVCLYGETCGILAADHGVFVGGGEADAKDFAIGLQRVPRPMLDVERCWSVRFE